MMNPATRNLEVTTRGDREIVITRDFAAPRALVYEAMTKPALLKRWLGVFDGWSLEVCEVDARTGGSFRYQWRGPKGEKMGMRGEYREVVPNERLVSTEVFDEAWYPGEAVGTAVFTEQDGRTTLTTTVVYMSREVRDNVLKSGMAGGMSKSYSAMEEMLAELAAA
jgi:uncharacterized protein YndB with AHSA1/START domain